MKVTLKWLKFLGVPKWIPKIEAKCKKMQQNESPHFVMDSHFEIWGPTLVPISS
jgi:hypothetical protein